MPLTQHTGTLSLHPSSHPPSLPSLPSLPLPPLPSPSPSHTGMYSEPISLISLVVRHEQRLRDRPRTAAVLEEEEEDGEGQGGGGGRRWREGRGWI